MGYKPNDDEVNATMAEVKEISTKLARPLSDDEFNEIIKRTVK